MAVTVKKLWDLTGVKILNYVKVFLIEHYLKNSFPIRVGLVYSEAIFNSLEPTTIFTLGSGKKINNFNIDFAMNYSMNTYRYYDIFPIDNIYNQSCENDVYCNQVKETQLSFLTTIKLGF